MKPFSRDTVIRGYEVDASRTTPLPVVLSFLEQLRWEWMSAPDWGLADQIHEGFFFVVRRQTLELVERPRFGQTLTVEGEIERIGRSEVIIHHRLLLGNTLIGHAHVSAVWLSPRRRLAKIPAQARDLGRTHDARPLGILPGAVHDGPVGGDPQSFLDAPRQLFKARGLDLSPLTPPVNTHTAHVHVRPSDCDVFQHVNASQYLRYCDDARRIAGHHALANRVSLDYAAEALVGQDLQIHMEIFRHGLFRFSIERDNTALCRVLLHAPEQ